MLNRASYIPVRQMLWQSGRAIDVAVRKQLKMRSGSLFGPYHELAHKQTPVIYGYSNFVIPRPADWDANTYVAGYWFLDEPADWMPPADLVDFLQAGPAPVYIGFGSMGDRDPEQTTRIVLDAVARTGQRAVLASGWGGMRQTEMPSTVHMLKSVPHSWLFPQMAAVVHHGGAGTTAAGVRAGVPSIITPFFGDQPFWGKRIADLGIGPAPIAKKALTAERLAQAITQAVSDTAMRQRAAELGVKVRAEDGANQAAKLISQLADRAGKQWIASATMQSSPQST
jgi:UDP:flavonoid glycosyltransferase YjiC (YdhE family)